MTLLDRYIARQYLVNVVTLLVILFSFIVAVDMSINVDRFSNSAGKVMADRGIEPGFFSRLWWFMFVVADLWWPRLLVLFNFILGLVMVGAMGFTCAQMVRHRELVAILAGGMPLHRVIKPIMACAVVLTGVQAVNQETLVPSIASRLPRDPGDAGRLVEQNEAVPLTSDGRGRVVYARSFDASAGVLEDLCIWERDETGLATRRIMSPRATWDGQAWRLESPALTTLRAGDPGETPPTRFETDLDPTALLMRRYARYSQNLSSKKLGEMLSRRDLLDGRTRAELERLRYGRVSHWMTNLLSMLICMPLFLPRVPQGLIAQSLKAIPIALIALFGSVAAASAPIPGWWPQVTVFLPVMVLLPIAILAVTSIRT